MRTSPISVPGPNPMPIIGPKGNLLQLLSDPIGQMGERFQKYGKIAALVKGHKVGVFATDPDCPGTVFVYGPELNEQVLNQANIYHRVPLSGPLYPRGNITLRQRPLLNYATGLFAVNDDDHRRHRRLLAPAFHKKGIEAYYAEMVALTLEMLGSWQLNEIRNVHEDMIGLTLRIVINALFGEGLISESLRVTDALQESFRLALSPLTVGLPLDLPGLPYRRLLNVVGQFINGLQNIIAQKRSQGAGSTDLLSMLLRAQDEDGSTLTETEVIGHAGLILGAGHETSAGTLTWTLFLLSQHPRFTNDLLRELTDELQGEPPTLEQLNKLLLLEYAIKESMRVLPVAPWNDRIIAQATHLGGYDLPVGTEILVSNYHTQHMPDIYREPEVFNPYRWADIKPSLFEYSPFGGGPRMCIGAPFAMMEMRIVLAILLQRYRLQFASDTFIDRKVGITMFPKNGLRMFVRKQDAQFEQGVGGVRGNVREMVELPS